MDLFQLWPFALVIVGFIVVFMLMRKVSKALSLKMTRMVEDQKAKLAEQKEKTEAMFRATFPELQPHFHPERVVEYIRARHKRGPVGGTWEDPPGFPAAKRAVLEDTPKGERTILEDAAGTSIAEFLYLEGDRPDVLGLLRLGPAKYRAKQQGHASYWHPHREFKWKGPGQWTFTSRVADDSIDGGDHGTSWSDSSSSTSSSSSMRTAALAGGAVGVAAAAAASADDGSTETSY